MWGFVRDIIVVEDLEGFGSEECACLRIYYGCCLSLQDLLGATLGLLEIPPIHLAGASHHTRMLSNRIVN